MDNTNKIVLVTGASRGIGKAIALKFAQSGYRVFGTATSEQGAQKISNYLAQFEAHGEGLTLDIKQGNCLESLVKNLQTNHGDIAVLVNNAGITRDSLLLRLSYEDWDEVIQTNLTGIFRLCKLVSRSMIKARHGKIINITSVVGHTGNPGQANYAASKAGVMSFSKSLAKEVGMRGITVNCVAPGFIKTDMTDTLSDGLKNSVLNQIPAGRFGSPDDVAKAVFFLASEDASYITGSTIHVNGGMFME